MTIRLLCKQTSKHPSNALFPQEQKTRIAPTRIINETELDLTAGMVVTVNWNREKVEVEIRLVYGTFITKTTFTLLFSQYHLQRVIIVCHLHVSYAVLHIVEMVAQENVVVFLKKQKQKQQESPTDIMIYVSARQEEICFILGTINFSAVSD